MLPKKLILSIICFLCLSLILSCGGSSGTASETTTDEEMVNTEKLIGTPFEGFENGDDFTCETFQEGDYLTDSVDTLPIKIFLAYFTVSEEIEIAEGIAIANEGINFDVFEITDVWSNDVRVIYKISHICNDVGTADIAVGFTGYTYFDSEGKQFADLVVTDWQIELRDDADFKWVTAHELGHAMGIRSHALIDYENDTIIDLEENSLMESDGGGSDPELTDYNYMMQMQGELLLRHLGETGTLL